MSFVSKRGVLLLVTALLLVAAAFAPAASGQGPYGAQPLAACAGLRCPNGTTLICNTPPCAPIDNCSMRCDGHVIFCSGRCIQE